MADSRSQCPDLQDDLQPAALLEMTLREMKPKLEPLSEDEQDHNEAILGIEDNVYNDNNDSTCVIHSTSDTSFIYTLQTQANPYSSTYFIGAIDPEPGSDSIHAIKSWKCGMCAQRFRDRTYAVHHVHLAHEMVKSEDIRPRLQPKQVKITTEYDRQQEERKRPERLERRRILQKLRRSRKNEQEQLFRQATNGEQEIGEKLEQDSDSTEALEQQQRTHSQILQRKAFQDRERRHNETDEQRSKRLFRTASTARRRYQNETEDYRTQKRLRRLERERESRQNETDEQRADRLLRRSIREHRRRRKETVEERDQKLREKQNAADNEITNKCPENSITDNNMESSETEQCKFCVKSILKKYMLRHIKYHVETGTAVLRSEGQTNRVPKMNGSNIGWSQFLHTRPGPSLDLDNKAMESFKCSLCNKSFHQEFLLKMHQKQDHSPETHNCQHCNKGFKSIAVLNKHKTKSHPEGKQLNEAVTVGLEAGNSLTA